AQGNGMASIETSSLITIDLPSRLPDQLSGDEPFGEGARRVLRRIFEKMLAREEGVRTSDEDPEDVHQMRVATRKLRAALQIVEPVFEPQFIRQYRRDLRRVAQDLGAVRDYDVFLMDVQGVQQTLPEGEQTQLQTFVSAITEERLKRRVGLLEDLQTKRYNRFKQLFATFLTEPGAGVLTSSETGVPPRIRDMAGSMIWRRYEQWRAFEVLLDNGREETLHDARIAGKRLRYTIEFFADALGPRVNQVLEPLIALQDNLGNIQDGAVFQEHIRDLGLAKDAGAQTYLKARLASHDSHLAEYPALWAKVASATYRRNLFGLIVKM
ncbi:MAG: CHAD domain-containing protein, partial [Chloroflexota bacterium]